MESLESCLFGGVHACSVGTKLGGAVALAVNGSLVWDRSAMRCPCGRCHHLGRLSQAACHWAEALATAGAGPLCRLESDEGFEGDLILSDHLEGRLGDESLRVLVVRGAGYPPAIP